MELISKGNDHPSKSRITILPFIDLSPSDVSCIYPTLLHTIDQARQKKIFTPSVTFDQCLWIKSMEIVKAKGLILEISNLVILRNFKSLEQKMMTPSQNTDVAKYLVIVSEIFYVALLACQVSLLWRMLN